VKSAHDCSEGGLAVALAECCFNPEKLFGADVRVGQASGLPDQDRKLEACATLFHEAQSRIIISVAPENFDRALSILSGRDIPFQQLGKVGGDELCIRLNGENFSWSVAELYDDWWNSIRHAVESESAEPIPSL
jgi:phosphoribosylformylglycinamidine synthase